MGNVVSLIGKISHPVLDSYHKMSVSYISVISFPLVGPGARMHLLMAAHQEMEVGSWPGADIK